jgi:integrase
MTTPTLGTVVQEWLDALGARNLRPCTTQNYRASSGHILRHAIGTVPVSELTFARLRDYFAELRGRLSPGSVRLVLNVARQSLARAVEDGHLTVHPLDKARLRLGHADKGDPDVFTPDELRAILTTARHLKPEVAVGLAAWAGSGVRRGEGDFDGGGRLTVRQTFSGNGRAQLGPPKTKSSNRTTYYTHPTSEACTTWHPNSTPGAQALLRSVAELKARLPATSYLLGLGPQPMPPRTLLRQWKDILRQAGVRHRHPELLRHGFASTLLARGAPVTYVARAGGWANGNVLLKTYARWTPAHEPWTTGVAGDGGCAPAAPPPPTPTPPRPAPAPTRVRGRKGRVWAEAVLVPPGQTAVEAMVASANLRVAGKPTYFFQ